MANQNVTEGLPENRQVPPEKSSDLNDLNVDEIYHGKQKALVDMHLRNKRDCRDEAKVKTLIDKSKELRSNSQQLISYMTDILNSVKQQE
ncbi:MAG TPA: hypothetical protein VKB19_20620 [Pedobacter sp.]|nr:hypothetical protein [Pedobacter sp.]